MAALELPFKVKVLNAHSHVSEWYGPYASVADAKTTVIEGVRGPGLTVGIVENGTVVEYWWPTETDLSDNALVPKSGAGGTNFEVGTNTGLDLTGEVLNTIYNTTIDDNVQSVAVGGAPSLPASEWKQKNIVQALDTILFPTIEATISQNKSVTLSLAGGGDLVEIGTPLNLTLTASFVDGQITNGDGTLGPDLVGPATAYQFAGTGISVPSQPSNVLSFSHSVVSGSNNWSVVATHDAGTGDYFDNKANIGTNLDAQRAAGTTTDSASSPTLTGAYKQFYGPSAVPITSSADIRALSSNFATVNNFNSPVFTENTFIIAIPSTRTLLNVLTTNNENITSQFDLQTVDVEDAGGNLVSYKLYTYTSEIPLAVSAAIQIG